MSLFKILYLSFLRGYVDSPVLRPIGGNKRRFPNAPAQRAKIYVYSLDGSAWTSARTLKNVLNSTRVPRARGACDLKKKIHFK